MLNEDFDEKVLPKFFKTKLVISFRVVFPELPVIPMIFALVCCLVAMARLLSAIKVFGTRINFFEFIPLIDLFTTTFSAPFAIASLIKLCPSFLFPLIAKNKDLKLTCFEFMETLLKLKRL